MTSPDPRTLADRLFALARAGDLPAPLRTVNVKKTLIEAARELCEKAAA